MQLSLIHSSFSTFNIDRRAASRAIAAQNHEVNELPMRSARGGARNAAARGATVIAHVRAFSRREATTNFNASAQPLALKTLAVPARAREAGADCPVPAAPAVSPAREHVHRCLAY